MHAGSKELTPLLLGMASSQAAAVEKLIESECKWSRSFPLEASPSFQAGRSEAVYRAALDMGEPVVGAVEVGR